MFVLSDLWYGNISPVERYVRHDSEYKKALNKASDKTELLLAHLTSEDKELFDEFYELNSKMIAISEEDAFVCGFRLGAKMMLDVLTEYKGQFRIESAV